MPLEPILNACLSVHRDDTGMRATHMKKEYRVVPEREVDLLEPSLVHQQWFSLIGLRQAPTATSCPFRTPADARNRLSDCGSNNAEENVKAGRT